MREGSEAEGRRKLDRWVDRSMGLVAAGRTERDRGAEKQVGEDEPAKGDKRIWPGKDRRVDFVDCEDDVDVLLN